MSLTLGVRREVTLSAKDAEGEEEVRRVSGLRDSFSIVARRPKWDLDSRSSLNWEASSWDAVVVV